jgi:putative ABC transport system substrate-binding protein
LWGGDPVRIGLVPRLNRPGANVTGFSAYSSDLLPKRLQLLRELVPTGEALGYLVNPKNPLIESDVAEARRAAEQVGVRLHVINASAIEEIQPAISGARESISGMVVQLDPFFGTQRKIILELGAKLSLPMVHYYSHWTRAGGLISDSPNFADGYRHAGLYASRILKGEKSATCPCPPTLLARADEVIE